MPPKRYLVVAGTHQEYRFFCRENEIDHLRGARFVSSLDSIRGLSPEDWTLIRYGSRRNDWYEIREYADTHGFKGPQ